MKRSEWSDKQLEELLRQMPKIQDHRKVRDIYQNLSLRRRKPFPWLFTGLAAAVAAILIFILVPPFTGGSLFSQYDTFEQKSTTNKKMSSASKDKISDFKLKKADTTSQTKAMVNVSKTDIVRTALYADEAGNGKILTYWIPDPRGQILIPVSTVVNKVQGKSWLDYFNEGMADLRETEWGLSEYYPLKASITLDKIKQQVLVDVPAGNQYAQGSESETGFINIVKKDVSSNSEIKKIQLSTAGQKGIEFGNSGMVPELKITSDQNHAYLLYYAGKQKLPFLVPSNETYKDIKSALSAMRNDQPVLGLKKSLTPEFKIKNIVINGKMLMVTLGESNLLKDNQKTSLSFEALLLTAKEFGLEGIIVKNAPSYSIGPFDLSKENKVPLAPNLRSLE